MKRFLLEKSNDEFYTYHSGLALVGACINCFTDFKKRVNDVSPQSSGISHVDIARSYPGLLGDRSRCITPRSGAESRR